MAKRKKKPTKTDSRQPKEEQNRKFDDKSTKIIEEAEELKGITSGSTIKDVDEYLNSKLNEFSDYRSELKKRPSTRKPTDDFKPNKTIGEVIIEFLSLGFSFNSTAKYCGMSSTSLYNLLEREPAFARECYRAAGHPIKFAQMKLMENVKKGNQRAIEFFLNHRSLDYKDEMGLPDRDILEELQNKEDDQLEFIEVVPKDRVKEMKDETED